MHHAFCKPDRRVREPEAKRQRFDSVITDFCRPGKIDGLEFVLVFEKAHPFIQLAERVTTTDQLAEARVRIARRAPDDVL